MCCCGRPTINGEPNAYSWDGKTFMTRQPDPPPLEDGDTLLYDGPGRCGGIDSHCHHIRVVKDKYGRTFLKIKHGGGVEQFDLGHRLPMLDNMPDLYWWLIMVYWTAKDAATKAHEATDLKWHRAAVQKRIKTRKMRGDGRVKVWIEPETK